MKAKIFGSRWLFMAGPLLLASVNMPADAGQRPLSDFLSRQMAWCLVPSTAGGIDCAASYYGGPMCANGGFLKTFPQFWQDPKTAVFAGVDPLGQLQAGVTTVNGSVSESTILGCRIADVGDRHRPAICGRSGAQPGPSIAVSHGYPTECVGIGSAAALESELHGRANLGRKNLPQSSTTNEE